MPVANLVFAIPWMPKSQVRAPAPPPAARRPPPRRLAVAWRSAARPGTCSSRLTPPDATHPPPRPQPPPPQPASPWNILGLVLIMGGLITYRFWPLVQTQLAKMGLGKAPVETEDEETLLGDDERQ